MVLVVELDQIPEWMEPFDPELLAPEGDPEHDCDGEIDLDDDDSDWVMP